MTQIVDKRLVKMCNKCQSMFDKPCAWLSLGNEYCDEIMNIQHKIDQLTNNWNELEESIKKSYYKYTGEQINALQDILDKMKEIKGDE